MRQRLFTSLLLVFSAFYCLNSSAQIYLKGYNEALLNKSLYHGRWPTKWITAPDATNGFEVIHFRKSFYLPSKPAQFIINISADTRFKLYVNGHFAGLGPARGDFYNWNFVTKDISQWLREGQNTLAVMVWSYGNYLPAGQMTAGLTDLVVQGNTAAESVVNTDESWLCLKNTAIEPLAGYKVRGYYAVGPNEKITAARYPWAWEQPDYDDSSWQKAVIGRNAAMKGMRDERSKELVPQPIPEMEYAKAAFQSVRKADGMELFSLRQGSPLTFKVPANKHVRLLLDNGQLTTAYMNAVISGGKGGKMAVGYAECLYTNPSKGYEKGNRNDIEGKYFVGVWDTICPDGAANRSFQTLWYRTYRYVAVDIQTADDPLIVNDLYGISTAYPFKKTSSFSAEGHPLLDSIVNIGWHTARLCANETYMDCPYYEQLQYFGDTRIQTMITLYNTTDSFMVRHTLEMGRAAMTPNGIIMSRFPSSVVQFIPPYALSWTGMIYDYWMLRGDEAYLKTLLPTTRAIVAWFEQYLQPDWSLRKTPFWNFTDWVKRFNYGEAPTSADGHSSIHDLEFVCALHELSQMEAGFGDAFYARKYSKMADSIVLSFREKYWDERRKMFANTTEKNSFSQHTNILAILAGVVKGDEARRLFRQIEHNADIDHVTSFYQYYLNEARLVAGLGDEYIENLDEWRNQLSLGLTTWAESPEPTRSDCHAWSASPNVELLRTVLGVRTGAPGFRKIIINPHLKGLHRVSGKVPHPNGEIGLFYEYGRSLKATITIPEDAEAVFLWHGKEYPLHSGTQVLKIKD